MVLEKMFQLILCVPAHLIVLHADKEQNEDTIQQIEKCKQISIENVVRTPIDESVAKDPGY